MAKRRGEYELLHIDIAPVLRDLGYEVPEVIGDKWVSCLCPFHDDSHPSAAVNQTGFHCFSCGKEGDAVSLLMQETGVSFLDAKRRAEAAAGCESTTATRKPRRRPSSTLLGFTRDYT